MPIAICPNCRSELEVPPELFGGAVRCANCLLPFEPGGGLPIVRQAKPLPARRSMTVPDRPRSRAWLMVLLAGCSVIALVCMGSCVAFVNVWRNPTFKTYTDPDGAYVAVFPGETFPISRLDAQGRPLVGVESKREFPEEQYFIESLDPEEAPKGKRAQTPKSVVDEWIAKNGASVIENDPVKSHKGFDAAEAVGQLGFTKGNFAIRAVKVGDRVYLLGITGTVMPGSEYVDRFFEGFEPKGVKPAE